MQAINLVVGIILARLLLPEQFGLVAMVAVFLAVSQALLDSGFAMALIQKRDATYLDECSVFYFNFVVGVVLAGLLCLAAPMIAAFYGEPALIPLTYALSSVLVIRSFAIVQRTILAKKLDFKSQAQAAIAAAVCSGILGVSLAFWGFGIWSLAAYQIALAAVQTAVFWFLSSWRPALQCSYASLRGLFGFGSRMLASSLVATVYQNIHTLVIGKAFSAADLGFYSRGNDLAVRPGMLISTILNRVAFPVFSQVQDDHARLVRGMRKSLAMLAFLSFPALIGLAVVARPLVIVLLTDRWLQSVPMIQMLCVSGAMYPLHAIHLNVLKALGRSDLFLRLEFIKKGLAIANIVVMLPFGLLPLVAGTAILSICGYLLNSHYTRVVLGYTLREQLGDVFPALAAAGAMGVAVIGVGYLPFSSDLLQLIAQIAAGVLIYAVACQVLHVAAFGDTLMYLRPRLSLLSRST